MVCSDVGSSNPDIAGLGVILSFTIQAGLSFFLSLLSVSLQSHIWSRPRLEIADQSGQPRNRSSILALARAVLNYTKNKNLETLLPAFISSGSSELQSDHISDLRLKIDLIDRVLGTISDIQILNGISLLIGAITQHRTLSLYHYHIVYDTVNFTGISTAVALIIIIKKPETIVFRSISIFGFLSLYVAFIILFGLKLQSWDDGVMGHCYRASGISTQGAPHPYVDNIYLAITAFYLIASFTFPLLVAILGFSRFFPNLHPATPSHRSSIWIRGLEFLDLFLYICSLDSLGYLYMMQAGNISPQLRDSLSDASFRAYNASKLLLSVALVQYPVHVYTLFALRNSNETYLSGDSENQWGFGQVVALVLVASVLLECFRAIIEYYLLGWKRKHPGATGYKGALLSLFRVLPLDSGGGQGSSAPKEHPTLLRRQQSLPANMKYQ